MTEIALDNGFSGSSSFAKAFKSYYGISASKWRTMHPLQQNSNFGNVVSNPGKAAAAGFAFEFYHCGKNEETGTFDVSICVPVRPL